MKFFYIFLSFFFLSSVFRYSFQIKFGFHILLKNHYFPIIFYSFLALEFFLPVFIFIFPFFPVILQIQTWILFLFFSIIKKYWQIHQKPHFFPSFFIPLYSWNFSFHFQKRKSMRKWEKKEKINFKKWKNEKKYFTKMKKWMKNERINKKNEKMNGKKWNFFTKLKKWTKKIEKNQKLNDKLLMPIFKIQNSKFIFHSFFLVFFI